MPIYSELQVKAPDPNAFAANTVINFLRLDGAVAQPGLNTAYLIGFGDKGYYNYKGQLSVFGERMCTNTG